MIAVLVDNILCLDIVALLVLDLYLDGMLVDDAVKPDRTGILKNLLRKSKTDMSTSMVDGKLTAEEKFKLLEVFGDSPMRKRTSILGHVPCSGKRVADEQVLVFLLFLPLGEVVGVASIVTNLLCDVEQVRLPSEVACLLGPLVAAIDIIGEVVGQALRRVVPPRQRHRFELLCYRVPGLRRRERGRVGNFGRAKRQFIDIDLVKGLVEVLLRPAFKELRLDLGIVDFGNGD